MTTLPPASVALFGSYDIRGRFPAAFPPETCGRIADAFLRWTDGPFVVARDSRGESAQLERAVGGALGSAGRSIVRLGIQPTPVVGFAAASLRSTGLAFTPSHNAVGYAGIKAFARTGRALGPEWSQLRRVFADLPPHLRVRTRRTRHRPSGLVPFASAARLEQSYLDHVTRGLGATRSVVIDGRGGATTRLAPRALARLGATVVEMHPRFSPTFYRLSPEPQREDVGPLGRVVRARHADLGVTFDGDGDRVAFVDERGRWVEPEVIAVFLHRHLSAGNRPLVASVDASQRCESLVPTVRSRVGSRFVSGTMRRENATVGFEASSHFYLRRWGPNSDGILVACVVSHLLEQERTTLGALRRAFGPVIRDRQVLEFPTRAEAARYLEALVGAHPRELRKGIDGFVFRSKEGSLLLRLSNTQPAVRVLLEPNRGRSLDPLRRVWARIQTRSDARYAPSGPSHRSSGPAI